MPETHVPMRTCVICRGKFPQAELTRFACPPSSGPDARLVADQRRQLPGRGFYLCGGEQCRGKFTRYGGWRAKCKG